jgi:hypothetical protein
MVLVVGDPRGCLFDAAVWSTRGEPHDQGIAKPTKRHLHIIRCERAESEAACFQSHQASVFWQESLGAVAPVHSSQAPEYLI